MTLDTTPAESAQMLERVVIRFAGDSGDGMQLVGDRFTEVSGVFGNDLATFPDFPAEIRAPAGTVAGVSSFQVHISARDIVTPGDAPNVLVAMNPAALRANVDDLLRGASILVNTDAFEERDLAKAGYESNPLTDDSLSDFKVYEVPMTSLTVEATKELGVKPRDAERSKNFFALGLLAWMFTRPFQPVLDWIDKRFASREQVRAANAAAFKAGWNFGITAELFDHPFEVQPAELEPGRYRNITGNVALSYGLVAAATKSQLPLVYASYPITPASDILHELSKHKNFGVRTIQAEDEIAAAGVAVGAAFSGALGVTGTSGPGLDLKSETIGLALSLELPMVIVDVQRGGPSTGLPTKTEQADLMAAMYGRHGEAPMPVVAAKSPADCFDAAFEAARIALKYRTPVLLLTDGYLANSAEPWRLPEVDGLADISVPFATQPNHDGGFWPYLRDPDTLARPWAIPGTPDMQHRVGGLEKRDGSGDVEYDGANHERMSELRAEKVARIADDVAPARVDGDEDATVVVVGWGSTWGAIKAAVRRIRQQGKPIARVHLTHVSPLPANLGEVLERYERVIVPELNLGQLSRLLRAEYLVDTVSINKMQGVPFQSAELEAKILEIIE